MCAHKLESLRLVLHPLDARHADLIYDDIVDERIWLYFPKLRPKSVDALRDRFLRWSAGPPRDVPAVAFENWVGFLREDLVPIGTFQATIMNDRTAHVAYSVFPRFWRNGYAVEAMSVVVEHVLHAHRVECLVASMDERNTASVKVARALGFSLVGSEHVNDEQSGTNGIQLCYERRGSIGVQRATATE